MNAVLVPTDFSPAARNAADYAAGLCKELGASMILLHVYMLPVPVSEIPYVMISADEIQKASENALQKEVARLTEMFGIGIEWIVRMGLASDEIRDIEKEKNIRMVIMGMKGGGELDKLIGSTTIAVIRKCQQAVFVIPAEAKFIRFRMAAYATDFSYPMNPACFEPLINLLLDQNTDLMIVNVQKSGKTMTPNQITGKHKLEEILANVPHSYHIIEDSHIEHGLQEFSKTQSPDLLAMAAHKHNILERLFGNHHTDSMIYQTHVPLLILQDKN